MEIDDIKKLIHIIRDKQVILDSDVAMLYNCDTKRINQAVKRNKERFPENFCFKLTNQEYKLLLSKKRFIYNQGINMRSQIVTASGVRRNVRYLPYVFTESGIAMLSGSLRNDIAIQISINIMNAFVEMRKFIKTNSQVFERLTNVEYKILEHDKKFDIIFDELQQNDILEQKIFYKGQIYDAISLIIDIFISAELSIIIIDNYLDKSVLDILSLKNDNVSVVLITSSNLNNIVINKFNEQYPNINVINSDYFHDRFIVIDNKEIYHLGASLKI